MAKTALICAACGYRTLKWVGRCPECGEWDSFEAATARSNGDVAAPLIPLAEVDPAATPRLSTGIDELDRVLGGGLCPGSVTLIAGNPGIGKSTLTLQAAAGLASRENQVVIALGEESMERVAERAARVGGAAGIRVTSETSCSQISYLMAGADVVVVDSVQTLQAEDVESAPGSASQVRHCVGELGRAARETQTALILVGHVTKDGSVAGPKTLEHLVDVVLSFEGDRSHELRMLRAVKNRFGSTAELGVFEMTADGLSEVGDPSGLFFAGASVAGSVAGCVLEGSRAIVAGIETLVVRSPGGSPRRLGQGVEGTRLAVMAAVVEKRGGIPLGDFDLYARLAGGLRSDDPGLDLPLALALAGGRLDKRLPETTVAIGEVGLSGEVRIPPGVERRLAEATRFGFTTALVPLGAPQYKGLDSIEVTDLASSLKVMG